MRFVSKTNAEKYIRDYIIPEISDFLSEDTPFDGNKRVALRAMIEEIARDGHVKILHEGMLTYMERYFYARDGIFSSDYRLKRILVEDIIEYNTLFGEWASGQDILKATDEWGRALLTTSSGAWHFLWMMERMIATGYKVDWEALVKGACDRLMKEEVYGNYKRSELYAMLYGTAMIYSAKGLTDRHKAEMLELLKNHWDFLKNIYSVMFRCVVGYRFTNIAQVANTVTLSKENYPHLHLFYSVLKGRMDDFCYKKGDRVKLENQLQRIDSLMKSATPSTELDELYGVLFPDEFQHYLHTHRPKNYNQLETELEKFKEELKVLNMKITGMAEQLKTMASSSVPISVIADELLELSPGIAWEVFIQLNGMLIENEAWMKSAGEIRKRIRQKIQQESQPSVQATNYYAAGANHNDHQKHLHITNDKKQIGQA